MPHPTAANPFPDHKLPRKHHLPVRISTYHSENHTAKEIDWNNRSDRSWLQNHLHWAIHNNATVKISAADDNVRIV